MICVRCDVTPATDNCLLCEECIERELPMFGEALSDVPVGCTCDDEMCSFCLYFQQTGVVIGGR